MPTGDFTVEDLPHGNYRVCVVAPNFLDPCQWGTSELLRVNGPRTAVRVSLDEGALVEVVVVDEKDILREDKSAEGLFLVVELIDPAGKRRLLPLKETGQTARSYQELVPENSVFRLEVSSQRYNLGEVMPTAGVVRIVNNRFELPIVARRQPNQTQARRTSMFNRNLPSPAVRVRLKVEGKRP
jgi:hypothetical protein